MIRELLKQYNKHLAKLNSMKGKAWRFAVPASNIRRLDPNDVNQMSIIVDIAVSSLLKGQVLAVPTDTLYGLITLAEHSHKLYQIKRRSAQKPLGLFLDTAGSIKKYCVQTVPDEFLNAIYPGPVTLLFERNASVPSDFNPSVNTIGIRVPQAKFVRDLCRRLPFRLIAQTSANVSGGQNPLCIRSPQNFCRRNFGCKILGCTYRIPVKDFEAIWDDIDLIVDAGPILENDGADEGSTVIDLSVPGQYKMIRDGCAPLDSIHLLTEFGIRSSDEIERERLNEAGKGLKMLEIEAHEITKEEEAESMERGEEEDNERKGTKEEKSVEREEGQGTEGKQRRSDYI